MHIYLLGLCLVYNIKQVYLFFYVFSDYYSLFEQDNAPGLLVNGHRFELESLDSDPLLSRINEWDYPIFDLKEQAKDLILSQVRFCVFLILPKIHMVLNCS